MKVLKKIALTILLSIPAVTAISIQAAPTEIAIEKKIDKDLSILMDTLNKENDEQLNKKLEVDLKKIKCNFEEEKQINKQVVFLNKKT